MKHEQKFKVLLITIQQCNSQRELKIVFYGFGKFPKIIAIQKACIGYLGHGYGVCNTGNNEHYISESLILVLKIFEGAEFWKYLKAKTYKYGTINTKASI